jgi:hypothetical protein
LPTWSSIVHAKNVLKDGYSWRTGSGSSYFWFSTWSTFGPLGNIIPLHDIDDLHLTFKDVLSSTSPYSQILYTQSPLVVTNYINNMHANLMILSLVPLFGPSTKMEVNYFRHPMVFGARPLK